MVLNFEGRYTDISKAMLMLKRQAHHYFLKFSSTTLERFIYLCFFSILQLTYGAWQMTARGNHGWTIGIYPYVLPVWNKKAQQAINVPMLGKVWFKSHLLENCISRWSRPCRLEDWHSGQRIWDFFFNRASLFREKSSCSYGSLNTDSVLPEKPLRDEKKIICYELFDEGKK